MIYLDNAATSFPKPRQVVEKTVRAITGEWGNPGRSGHPISRNSAEEIFASRESLASLIGLDRPENIVFCSGATAALNIAIIGCVRALCRQNITPTVVTSPFEHNSVLRPLFRLEKENRIKLHLLSLNPDNTPNFREILFLRPHLLVLSCRTNTTGKTFPLSSLSNLTKPFNTTIIIDAAQALGISDVSFPTTGAHILCAPGHKGLFGIMGGGFLAISPHSPILPEAILSGGSGNDSFNPSMPNELPERLEAGTLPFPAIVSMHAGADFLAGFPRGEIEHHEKELKRLFLEGLFSMPDYRIYDPTAPLGPILFNHVRLPSEALAEKLEQRGIFVRAGFHCAPLAHKALKTGEYGAVRVSPGFFTTRNEIFETLLALYEIRKEIA